jgi:hypothetical protein
MSTLHHEDMITRSHYTHFHSLLFTFSFPFPFPFLGKVHVLSPVKTLITVRRNHSQKAMHFVLPFFLFLEPTVLIGYSISRTRSSRTPFILIHGVPTIPLWTEYLLRPCTSFAFPFFSFSLSYFSFHCSFPFFSSLLSEHSYEQHKSFLSLSIQSELVQALH